MAFRLDLQLTGVEDLLKLKAFTDPKLYEKALQGGLKYASGSVPTAAAKSIRQEYTIPSARVKQDIKGPFIRGDEATLIFSRKPPTLVQFGFNPGKRGGPQPGLGQGKGWGKPKPKGKPASAKILRAGARLSYPNTFLAKGLPFTRLKTGKLKVEHGPSTGSIFLGRSQFGDQFRAEVQARMNEQFIKGVQRVLDSAARGYGGR